MSIRSICGGFALALSVTAAGAGVVQDAIARRDVLALEALSHAGSNEARLALGAALSLRHKDLEALTVLEPLAMAGTEPALRAGACLALSDVFLRQGRYTAAHGALDCAQQASGKPLSGEMLQILTDTEILAAEKPMQLLHPATGSLPVRRDEAGLMRVRVAINGEEKRAVIDTDASFCVVTESVAQRLGLRVLDKPASILTTARADQPMRLAVADEVKFGDAVLSNVVFAVLPDKAMAFGPTYTMDAVIGLPVLVALGRIALADEDGALHLFYGPAADAPAEANMALSALDPFALLRDQRTGAVLRLAIDTAADKTTLNATALKEFPALAEGASGSWASWRGAGGRHTDDRALTIPELDLVVAGRSIALSRIKLLSDGEPDRHGAVGQDVLKGSRWAIDFDHMRFTVAP